MRVVIFLLYFLLVGCGSCKKSNFPDKFYDIQLNNNSSSTLKVYLALPEKEHLYPDTLIETDKPIIGFRTVMPNASTYFDSRERWEDIYNKHLPYDTLSIFIFDADTLEYYNWGIIRDEYKVLQRYDLSIGDLKKLDFKVPYPPTAEMAGMKMYP